MSLSNFSGISTISCSYVSIEPRESKNSKQEYSKNSKQEYSKKKQRNECNRWPWDNIT